MQRLTKPGLFICLWWSAIISPMDTLGQINPPQSEKLKHDGASLNRIASERFQLGVGVGHSALESPRNVDLLLQHFDILTPENCMKPKQIHPFETQWQFTSSDRFAEFARTHQVELVGHCLVWAKDENTPDWMLKEGSGEVSAKTLMDRLETHIQTVVRRYADVATMWDVVNEAIGDSDEGLLRDSVYTRTTGIDFIVKAFQIARAEDPDALLIYNDYNGHKDIKRDKLIELLTQLKTLGAPVDAYGMQGHFELGDHSIPQLRLTFDALRKLGIKAVVSELDIDVVTRGRWWADGGRYRDELRGYDPYREGLPEAIQQALAQQYRELFELFVDYDDIIERVSFWNLHDGHSWLNHFPWSRKNHPLLFDRQGLPKPAFKTVYEVLAGSWAHHAAIERQDQNSKLAHQDLVAKTKKGTIDIYFQGDSITRRWGATDYPKLLAHWQKHFHGWNAANFAWGGDNTHHILWRMRNGEMDNVSPKVIVLQAGANNLPWQGPAKPSHVDDVLSGIHAILDEFHRQAPEAEVVLTAMFPRPQNPELESSISIINSRLEAMAKRRQIRFLNINDRLTDASGQLLPGVSNDGLHLDEFGYEVWAKALKPIFMEILDPPSSEDFAPLPTGNPASRH